MPTAFPDLAADTPSAGLIACPHCDLLQREAVCSTPCAVRCHRCGALMYRFIPGALDATLALTVAAAALFAIANWFPVMSLEMQGQQVAATLTGIARALRDEGMPLVGALVFLTLVLAPGLLIAARLYVLLPLRRGSVPPGLTVVARALEAMRRWSMVEVFVLAAVVCMQRLSEMARLGIEPGFWALGALMLLFAVTDSMFGARDLWRRVS